MDSITLLEKAQGAGLQVIDDRGRLVIRGPKSAGAWARQLLERKPEVLALLSRPSFYPLTLVWPADTRGVGMVEGQWRRLGDGRIEAIYPSQEALYLALVDAVNRRGADLEREMGALLDAIRDCDDDERAAALVAELYAKMDEHQAALEAARASAVR